MTLIIHLHHCAHYVDCLWIYPLYQAIPIMLNSDILIKYGATIKIFKEGEVIFAEGDDCHYFYQLIRGTVKWTNYDSDGGEMIQEFISEGNSFGELPLFDGLPYAATAISESISELYRLPKEKFDKLIEENPQELKKLTQLFVKRLRFKFMILRECLGKEPENRVRSLFKYMRESSKNLDPNSNQITLSRQEIASMIGLRVETVIRTVRKMNDSGEIKILHGRIFLPN